MTGIGRTSSDLDPRRRKVLFRSWHRGTREMDLVLGRFADAEIDRLSDEELTIYEALIDAPDREIFSWITGTEATPAEYCLLYTSPSPRDRQKSRMPSSA